MFGWEYPPHNTGGLGVACMGLTRSLSERGFNIAFVMPKKLDITSTWAKMVFAGGSEYSVDSPITPYITSSRYPSERSKSIYANNLFDEVARYAHAAAEIAKREQFDVIYAHDWLSFGAGIEAKKISQKPLVAHVHATEYDRSGGGAVNEHVYRAEKEGMDAADTVVAVSEFTKKILIDKYQIPEQKIRVVHNGIDESTAPKGEGTKRLKHLKQAGYKIVLFLGRLTLQKGPDYFLRAAKKVLERDPRVMFIISGSGDMEEDMMHYAGILGIAHNVIFTGFLEGQDRHDVYVAADLFVMPSVSEPFGITPLESMQLGTPVLISKQSGVSEVTRHALKADFWDIDEMSNKILSVITHAPLRNALSENAQAESSRVTWATAALKIDGILNGLVK